MILLIMGINVAIGLWRGMAQSFIILGATLISFFCANYFYESLSLYLVNHYDILFHYAQSWAFGGIFIVLIILIPLAVDFLLGYIDLRSKFGSLDLLGGTAVGLFNAFLQSFAILVSVGYLVLTQDPNNDSYVKQLNIMWNSSFLIPGIMRIVPFIYTWLLSFILHFGPAPAVDIINEVITKYHY